MYKVNTVDTLRNCRNYRYSKTGSHLQIIYTRQEFLCHKTYENIHTECTVECLHMIITFCIESYL
jgi:hypothetical protein